MDGLLKKIQKFDVEKLKDVVGNVKNAVMNLSEYELKVREATNNDPWGASSTLMNEIAAGTNNFQHFPVIVETIYKKFVMTGTNWRQAYKGMILLEFLIKNGSERVIDSAREHVYDIKALIKFQYVDEKGKDQGVNVRHRAQELSELLNNTDRIQEERKKARENKNKYSGVSSDQVRGGSLGPSSGGKYGGFGSQTVPNGGAESMYRDDEASPQERKEPVNKFAIKMSESSSSALAAIAPTTTAPTANLFDFGSPVSAANPAAAPPASVEFADFGSFASAPPTHAKTAVSEFADFSSFQSSPASQSASAPTTQPSAFADFGSFSGPSNTAPAPVNRGFDILAPSNAGFASYGATPLQPTSVLPATSAPPSQQQQEGPDPIFGKLVSLDPASLSSIPQNKTTTGPSLNAMAGQQQQQQPWGF